MKWDKEKTLFELSEKIRLGKVDKDILPLLNIINSFEDMYTLSSCSGRILLLELPEIGDKKNAIFHGIWHSPVSHDLVVEACESYLSRGKEKSYLYLLMQSPILHLKVKSLRTAEEMFQLARCCGFKNSGFKSLVPPYLLEILSTERIDIPIGHDRKLMVKREEMEFFIERCNKALKRSKKKLEKLVNKLLHGELR